MADLNWLRSWAHANDGHLCQGKCPNTASDPSRDPECDYCRVLVVVADVEMEWLHASDFCARPPGTCFPAAGGAAEEGQRDG